MSLFAGGLEASRPLQSRLKTLQFGRDAAGQEIPVQIEPPQVLQTPQLLMLCMW